MTIAAEPSSSLLNQTPDVLLCTNETLAEGECFGMPVCGFCYDFGQSQKPPWEYEVYNLVVIGVLLPCIGLFGLFGNSISAFIYSRKNMRSSLNMYLCALAVSDITIISTSFFLFFAESMRKRSASISKYFALSAPIMFPLGLTAQTCSVFLTVTAAFDCFMLVIASDAVKHRFCSTRTAGWIITGVVIAACSFNLPHLFEVYVVNCWSLPFSGPNYDVCPTALRQNEAYAIIYYAYGYTIIMALGPVLLLLILNSAIVLIMRQSCAGVSDRNANRGGSDITTLVLVVCLFIACNILPLTVNFLELLLNLVNSYLIDFSNLMVVLNSSCNFLIYYAFGSQFRRTLKEYCNQYVWRRRDKLKYASVALDCGHCNCSRCCSNSASKHSLIDNATSVGASPAPMRV